MSAGEHIDPDDVPTRLLYRSHPGQWVGEWTDGLRPRGYREGLLDGYYDPRTIPSPRKRKPPFSRRKPYEACRHPACHVRPFEDFVGPTRTIFGSWRALDYLEYWFASFCWQTLGEEMLGETDAQLAYYRMRVGNDLRNGRDYYDDVTRPKHRDDRPFHGGWHPDSSTNPSYENDGQKIHATPFDRAAYAEGMALIGWEDPETGEPLAEYVRDLHPRTIWVLAARAESLSNREIARHLGCDEKTIRKMVRRAVERFERGVRT